MDRHQVLRLTSITMLLTVLFVGLFSILQALLMMIIGSLGSGNNLVYFSSVALELALFVSLVVLLAAEGLFMLAKVLPTDYKIILAMITQRGNSLSAVNLLTGLIFIVQIVFCVIYAKRNLRAIV